jgi:hypothetical protein
MAFPIAGSKTALLLPDSRDPAIISSQSAFSMTRCAMHILLCYRERAIIWRGIQIWNLESEI